MQYSSLQKELGNGTLLEDNQGNSYIVYRDGKKSMLGALFEEASGTKQSRQKKSVSKEQAVPHPSLSSPKDHPRLVQKRLGERKNRLRQRLLKCICPNCATTKKDPPSGIYCGRVLSPNNVYGVTNDCDIHALGPFVPFVLTRQKYTLPDRNVLVGLN